MLFDVRIVGHGPWEVARITGDVDLASIASLRAQLDQLDGDRVAVDLAGVDLFDPLGWGLLLGTAMHAARRGAKFVVVCPPGRPRELFAESGVDRILTVVDGLDALP